MRIYPIIFFIQVTAGCFLDNISLSGFTNGNIQTSSAQLCQESCQERPNCSAFTWNSRSRACSLKESWYGERTRNRGSVSGPAYCGQQTCFERNVMYFGHKLYHTRSNIRTSTPEKCQAECQTTKGCKAFTWTRGSNTCNLKSQISEHKMEKPGKISGPAHCNYQIGGVCPPPACVTSWRMGLQRFNGCADPLDQGGLWCPLPLGLDATGNWRNGSNAFAWCVAPPNCVKNWRYWGQKQTYCSTVNSNGQAWCPTSEGVDLIGNYRPGGKFIYCEPNMCLDAGSCQPPVNCAEKWFFRGQRQNFCSVEGSPGKPWCPNKYTLNARLQHIPSSRRLECDISTCSRTPCGQNAMEYNRRVVGGKPADPNEWPWLVALITPKEDVNEPFCGGSLISDTYVVTAAHCMGKYSMEDMKVKVGEYDFKATGETDDKLHEIRRIVVHEDYDDVTYDNDIALIQLRKPATFNKSVWPICLPRPDETYENYRAYVVGWGTIYYGGPVSSVLQEVNIRVWDQFTCKKNYKRLMRNITNKMICAGETKKDACQGDSGGPLNCLNLSTGRWELCGVVSFGMKCAEPQFPGIYTRTTEYLDWIKKNMRGRERRLIFL